MAASQTTRPDGTVDFSGGVNSVKPTTIASELSPNGLKRNELAWLVNGDLRDGGISPRGGWHPVGEVYNKSAFYQGGATYTPVTGNPYLLCSIVGHILMIDYDTAAVVDLSAAFGLNNPDSPPIAHFCQAEQFMIIQVGDGTTLPLFWDGTTLRRSIGITNTAVAPGTPGVNEIPAATCMDYYMGRLWYAQGRQVSAGDIVGGKSGTAAYNFKDAILNVTENPLVVGGDGFTVPDNNGNIRALFHNANLNTTTGQGQLFIGTRKAVYALNVPVTRNDWIAADSNNQPLQTVIQLVNGTVGDRSVVAVNGDIFYQSLEPGIRSLISAIRYFQQWGNKKIDSNENRVLQFTDRALLQYSTGIQFNSRLWQSTLPKQLPQGVVHQAVITMDFIPISNFAENTAPIWQGIYQGLDILQMFTADFGGRDRAFSLIVNNDPANTDRNGRIELWEMTQNSRTDNGDNRIAFSFESPAFTWNNVFELKKLVSFELWVDRLWGTANFTLEWRPDGQTCWLLWHKWQQCSAKNCAEDVNNPCTYPIEPLGDSYRQTMTLPVPPFLCAQSGGRPANVGYQHQFKLTVKGYCRVRGFIAHAEEVERKLYENMQCVTTSIVPLVP